MKKLTLFLSLLLLLTNLIEGQQQCSDIIYLFNGDSINNCCITDVEVGNRVTYFKKGKFKTIEAVAIYKGGQYLDLNNYKYFEDREEVSDDSRNELYKEHDYNYYQSLYKNATVQRNIGIGFTSLAAAFAIAGGLSTLNDNGYIPLALIGIATPISLAIGAPLWISGHRKRNNNKKAMDKIEKQMNLSFRATNNGVGLVLNF